MAAARLAAAAAARVGRGQRPHKRQGNLRSNLQRWGTRGRNGIPLRSGATLARKKQPQSCARPKVKGDGALQLFRLALPFISPFCCFRYRRQGRTAAAKGAGKHGCQRWERGRCGGSRHAAGDQCAGRQRWGGGEGGIGAMGVAVVAAAVPEEQAERVALATGPRLVRPAAIGNAGGRRGRGGWGATVGGLQHANVAARVALEPLSAPAPRQTEARVKPPAQSDFKRRRGLAALLQPLTEASSRGLPGRSALPPGA